MGTFHYGKLTGQRSARKPEEKKMERHFPIKLGQPIEMTLVILNSFSKFPNEGKQLVCQKRNSEFRSEYSDRNMWTTSRGDPEYSGQKKPIRTFPFE